MDPLTTNEKYPLEERMFFFDFGDFRASEDAAIVEVQLLAARNLSRVGEDEIAITGQVQSGMELQFKVSGGTAPDRYIITAVVVDSDSQRLEMQGYLTLVAPLEPAL